MERAWLALLGAVTFVVAAKTHGRGIRLERELAGHWSVVFGGSNPPFVEALWARDRWSFWSTLAVLVAASIGARFVVEPPRTFADATVWHFFAPFVGAFTLSATLSLLRFRAAVALGVSEDATRPADWLSAAWSGTAMWWSLLLMCAGALVTLTWRR